MNNKKATAVSKTKQPVRKLSKTDLKKLTGGQDLEGTHSAGCCATPYSN